MTHSTLPVISSENGLAAYMEEIRKFPVLEADEEYQLAKRWADDGDIEAAHTLVTSHLRLVVKMAQGFRGYGLPVMDLISEGNIGLMQAVKRFDPEKGFRLSTYAMWWIKASIQEFVLRSWSLVKIGTTAAQKKLFFNLRKMKNRMQRFDERTISPEDASTIAEELNVETAEVFDMDSRLSQADSSLNELVGYDGSTTERIELLAAPEDTQDIVLADREEHEARTALMATAMEGLNDRERDIIARRRLQEPSATLEDLSQEYGISRERVRQIEARAIEKLQAAVMA
jgi:RNA polymerase sigma-32 factor